MVVMRRVTALLSVGCLSQRAFASASIPLKGFRTDGVGGQGLTLIPSSGDYKNVVVWMHGLGDTADGWASLMPMLELQNTKYILPTAPERPITLNGGYPMPGWADVFSLDKSANEDAQGFHESAQRIQDIIKTEMEDKGIPSERIVVGGFSQGGALALHVSTRATYRLAGCAALSTWLPLRDDYPGALSEQSREHLRLFQAHGEADEVVRLQWGETSNEGLKQWLKMGSSEDPIDFRFMKIEHMGHSSDPAEIDALKDVLAEWLKEDKV
jgi:predicted esterase